MAAVQAFVALGANLGDPVRQVRDGLEALARLPQTRLIEASSLWRTAPVGGDWVAGQPDYINAVALLETTLDSHGLLRELQTLETAAGRERSPDRPMAARTLDLDLLTYGDEQATDPTLTLPHPRMHERAFVLAPLCEIAPNFMLHGYGCASELLAPLANRADQTVRKL